MTIAATLARPLQPGDRFRLTDEGARILRPRGCWTGLVIKDSGDEWALSYDGTRTVRLVHKSYVEREVAG